jgi:quinol monooxygenase YgiN
VKNYFEKNTVSLIAEIKLSPSHQREFLQVGLKIMQEGRLENGNEGYNLQRDMEKDFHYELQSEWKDKKSMETYIQSQSFGALLGALNVLTLSFDIKIHRMSAQEGKALIKHIRNK